MRDLFTDLTASTESEYWKKFAYAEATQERVYKSPCKLAKEGILESLLIGKENEIKQCAKEFQVSLEQCYVVDPEEYGGLDQMAERFVERRNGKATKTEAEQLLLDHNYFGTMLVY